MSQGGYIENKQFKKILTYIVYRNTPVFVIYYITLHYTYNRLM